MNEILRPVPVKGIQDRYLVSSAGNIYSLWDNKRKLAEPRLRGMSLHPAGYYRVYLCKTGKDMKRPIKIWRLAHQLICEAFHGPRPSSRHHAAHINGISTDNRASNLMWATPKENEHHKKLHDTRLSREKNHQAKLNERMVAAIKYIKRKHGFSCAELGRCFDVSYQVIQRVLGDEK